MSIRIDRGVPLPDSSNTPLPKYPWDRMSVGDSFFVKGATTKTLYDASLNRKKLGEKYTTRKEGFGARIWRIK